MRAMVITVGTGKGVEHGISVSINDRRPDFVVFLVTEKSKGTVEKVKNILKEKFGLEIKYEQKLIKNENDAEECYEISKKSILELKNKYKEIFIDFTSGTKAMTGGLILAGIVEEVDGLIYVTGERDPETGRVIPGTERVYTIPSPVRVTSDMKKNIIKEMFNNYQFYDCLKLIEDIKSKLDDRLIKEFKIDVFENIIKFYYFWDLFRHEEAYNLMKNIKGSDIEDILCDVSQINKNKEFLGTLLNTKDEMLRDKLLLADIICNAKRRIEEGKYDDAVARLYRSIEFIGNIVLKKRYGQIEVLADLISILPEEELREKYEKFVDEKGNVKLGLHGTYELLKDLNEEIGIKFKEDKKLHDLISKRNSSILAHGLSPVEKDDAEDLYNKVLEYARIIFDDIDSWIEKVKFPKI